MSQNASDSQFRNPSSEGLSAFQALRDRQSQVTAAQPESTPSVPEPEPFSAAYREPDPMAYSVETNADRLMDELFEDVERMIDRGAQLPIEPIVPEQTSALQTAPSPHEMLPPKLSPRELTLGEPEPDADLLLETLKTSAPAQKAVKSFDKLLLAIVCTSLVITGALWFFFKDKLQQAPLWSVFQSKTQSTSSVAVAPSPTAEELSKQQNESFLNYVERSLDRLDRAAESNRQAATLAKGVTPSPTASSAPTVLERVYIPVYQPPQVPNSAIASRPNAPAKLAPAPTAPIATNSSPPAIAPNISPNAVPSETHVLIGVMELGKRSAALVEINGTPRRIQMGESIGNSGWKLVSIHDQEAIVRRNGDVRSVYVGQQF